MARQYSDSATAIAHHSVAEIERQLDAHSNYATDSDVIRLNSLAFLKAVADEAWRQGGQTYLDRFFNVSSTVWGLGGEIGFTLQPGDTNYTDPTGGSHLNLFTPTRTGYLANSKVCFPGPASYVLIADSDGTNRYISTTNLIRDVLTNTAYNAAAGGQSGLQNSFLVRALRVGLEQLIQAPSPANYSISAEARTLANTLAPTLNLPTPVLTAATPGVWGVRVSNTGTYTWQYLGGSGGGSVAADSEMRANPSNVWFAREADGWVDSVETLFNDAPIPAGVVSGNSSPNAIITKTGTVGTAGYGVSIASYPSDDQVVSSQPYGNTTLAGDLGYIGNRLTILSTNITNEANARTAADTSITLRANRDSDRLSRDSDRLSRDSDKLASNIARLDTRIDNDSDSLAAFQSSTISTIQVITNTITANQLYTTTNVARLDARDDSEHNRTVTEVARLDSRITNGTGAMGSWNINAATATTLQTARNINGTSFNGSTDITTNIWGTARNITIGTGPGATKSVNGSTDYTWTLDDLNVPNKTGTGASGSWSINSATATTLQTARNINGVSFNGSADITITANTPNTLTRGSYLTGSNFNGSAATTWAVDATSANTANKVVVRDASGDFSAGTITANLSGNATTATNTTGNSATATRLQTPRNINGVAFDGSANITIADSTKLPLTGGTLTGNLVMSNNDITGVGNIVISDPGPNEGISWADGNLWAIYESPNDLTTNTGGNLQIVQGTTRRATYNTSGQLELPIATGTAPLLVNSTTRVSNLNVARAGTADALTTTRTINGVNFDGTSNITITANTPNTLTRGSYLVGSNFNGSAAVTWDVDAASTNTANKVVVRDGSGNFAAGTITATLSGNATTSTTASTANALNTSNSYQIASLGVGTAASGTTGEIRATNNITAYYSDDRLKTKLGVIENALDKIDELAGFYYEANQTAQDLGYEVKREVGVSAQSVQKVMPEVVAPAPIDEKYLTVRYERLVPLLIEGIKELRAEIKALKGE